MSKKRRKLRRRVDRLEKTVAALIQQVNGDEPRKWKDCYVTDLDPPATLIDELQDGGPLPGYIDDDDDGWRGVYL